MANKHSIKTFSAQVDDLLDGKAAPVNDPLLSLASQMAIGPALEPSPAFIQRLRRQLLAAQSAAAQPARATRRPLRWSLAGTAAIVLFAVALALEWNPGLPSATEVLARAVDAIAVAPGQIEHIVFKWDVIPDDIASDPSGRDSGITESWVHIDTVPENHLAAVENASTTYSPDDTGLIQPLYQTYYSPSMQCFRDLALAFPELDTSELEQCLTFDTSPEPSPAARYIGESPQGWITRMQTSAQEIEVQEGQFNNRPVYSLTYQSQERHTIISTEGSDEPITIGSAITPDTMTLYIDHETYYPVGQTQIASYGGRTFTTTFTILSYQVVDPTDLDHNPFAWSPE